MNNPSTSRIALGAVHRSETTVLFYVLLANVAVWSVMTPLAYWRLATDGVFLVSAAGLTVLVVAWLSGWLARRLEKNGDVMTGFLAAMIVRMAGPIVFVVAIVFMRVPSLPPSTALVIVPFYVAMLVIETLFSVRRCHDLDSK